MKNFWNKYKRKWWFWLILVTLGLYFIAGVLALSTEEEIPQIIEETIPTEEMIISPSEEEITSMENITETTILNEELENTVSENETTTITYFYTTPTEKPITTTTQIYTTTTEPIITTTQIYTTTTTTTEPVEMITVWVTQSGKKYHIDPECPGSNAYAIERPINSISSEDWCGNCSTEYK